MEGIKYRVKAPRSGQVWINPILAWRRKADSCGRVSFQKDHVECSIAGKCTASQAGVPSKGLDLKRCLVESHSIGSQNI